MSIALLTPSSTILVTGDSISSTFGSSPASNSWTDGYLPQVRTHWVPDARLLDPAPARRWPLTYIDGVAGRATGDITSGIAARLTSYRRVFTHLIWQLGINDAAAILAATLTLNQFKTNVTTLLNAGAAAFPSASQIWLGPWCHATDDLNVQIAQIDAAMPGLLAPVGGAYVQWSLIPHAGVTTDGTHPTLVGAQNLAVPVLAAVAMS